MEWFISTHGAVAPTVLELELLRDLALRSQDASLRVAVSIARTDPALVTGATLTEAVQRANARCLQEIERWRATQADHVATLQLIDMAASAIRGSDYYALHVIRVAMDRNPTLEQSLALSTCLTAWNSRAARLAGAA